MAKEETTLDRVKALFQKHNKPFKVELEEETAAEEKVNLATATLEDGTVINSDSEEWAEGVNAYVLGEEGEKIPVPTGEYKLEDGTMLTITDGMVDAIAAAMAEEEVEQSEETEKTEEAETEVEQAEDKPEEIESKLASMIDGLRTEFTEMVSSKDTELEGLKAELEAKTKEIETLKTNFEHQGLPKAPQKKEPITRAQLSEMTMEERITHLSERYKN